MIPPEMYVWFGAALIAAGIVLLIGWKLTEPQKYRFEVPETYTRFQPARAYHGRHRTEDLDYGDYAGT